MIAAPDANEPAVCAPTVNRYRSSDAPVYVPDTDGDTDEPPDHERTTVDAERDVALIAAPDRNVAAVAAPTVSTNRRSVNPT